IVGTNPTGDFAGHANDIATYSSSTTSWTFTTPDRGAVAKVSNLSKSVFFTGLVWVDYDPFSSIFSPATVDDTPYKQLGEGGEGSLFDSNGNIDPDTANEILTRAFLGDITDDVVNTTNLYFGLVWDAGYPDPVKDAIVQLASDIRQDCVALVDNGDNATMEDEITARTTKHTYDTYYAAIYTTYTYVYDEYSGTYIWVSPLYHLASVIGGETYPWFAPAGETNATLTGIHGTRYNIPNVNWRDQFTINQLNPIIKFSWGYTIWGDYTSQRYASKMQLLPVVRMVLYTAHALKNYCESYVLSDQNDAMTWDSIRSEVSLFLSRLKTLRAISSFNVDVGATDYEMKTNQCHVNVELVPVAPLHIINLNFFING
ncbi:MAG: DUF2793 domain-containing protein, partial [Crenarchaeota archaeon]|nr:DUF2793 domain-containing protein [Thermoproteota archaeon]